MRAGQSVVSLRENSSIPRSYELEVPGEENISYFVFNYKPEQLSCVLHVPCRNNQQCSEELGYFTFSSAEEALLKCARTELGLISERRGLPFTDLTLKDEGLKNKKRRK